MTKKVASFFQEKIAVTPSVAASGDTNPSDATVRSFNALHCSVMILSNDYCHSSPISAVQLGQIYCVTML